MIRIYNRSILFRIMVFVGIATFLLPAATGFYLYSAFSRAIAVTVDNDLRNTANLLLHRLNDDRHPVDKELLDVGEHLFIRISDAGKQVLIESKRMNTLVPAAIYPMAASSGTAEEGRKELGHRFKLLTVAYAHGWIQVARLHDTEDALLRGFLKSLIAVLGTIPILATLGGFVLVRQALKPLHELARRTVGIRPDNLAMRLDPSHFPRELAPMAEALNHTIAGLESSFTRLGEMNGDLAHELRTPVHALRLDLEHLLSRPHAPELEEPLTGMMETLDHMAAVIEQMLFLARSEDPATRIERLPLDVHQLLHGAIAPFGSLAEEDQVELQVEIRGDPMLMGEATLIRRALHNLLANALRHSSPGDKVLLRAWAGTQGTILEVEDEGEGIQEELLRHLGQRFMRPDGSRSRKTGGAGLGLAIVQGIARMHGGTLEIQRLPGRGTSARLILPPA